MSDLKKNEFAFHGGRIEPRWPPEGGDCVRLMAEHLDLLPQGHKNIGYVVAVLSDAYKVVFQEDEAASEVSSLSHRLCLLDELEPDGVLPRPPVPPPAHSTFPKDVSSPDTAPVDALAVPFGTMDMLMQLPVGALLLVAWRLSVDLAEARRLPDDARTSEENAAMVLDQTAKDVVVAMLRRTVG